MLTVAGSDGRLHAPRHAARGAARARAWLMAPNGGLADRALPFTTRERVVSLIGLHGLPLRALEHDDAEVRVSAASLQASGHELGLLAEADVRGRRSHDVPGLLERLELFREYVRELGCLYQPRPFPSAHTRFRFFHTGGRTPATIEQHDGTWGEVTLMSGLPAAGKDRYMGEHLAGLEVVSLDDIRRELGVAPAADQGRVVQRARGRARELLRARRPFVWNATSTTRLARRSFVDLATSYGARVHIVYVERPLDVIEAANRRRPASVLDTVIRRLARRLQVPDLTEAHRVSWVVS